jgi:hypothetical protein
MAVTWRRLRIRWVVVPVCLLLIAAVIGGLPVYVRPQVDPPRHADAILVLGGDGFRRYPFGIDLGMQGWAPKVVLSDPAPRVNRGALFQDWAERRAIQNALDPDFLNRLSAIVYASDRGRSPSPLRWKNYDPGLTSNKGDLVISQDQLYKLDNGRFRSDSTLARGNYHRIFVCNQAIVPSRTGWRVLQPSLTYVNFDDDQNKFRCWLEDPTNR